MREFIQPAMVIGSFGKNGVKKVRNRRVHTWTADLLMDALRDKFATQSNSVRRAFREAAQPGRDTRAALK